MKSLNADVFFNVTTPKFAAHAIKKMAEIEWKPLHFLNNVSVSIGSVIKPAGMENAQGIISSAYLKDPTDAQWKDDAGMKAWNEFLDKYYPEANRADASVIYGYTVAQGLVQVLKQCGDDLTRANVMKQAASIKDLQLGGLLPGGKGGAALGASAERHYLDELKMEPSRLVGIATTRHGHGVPTRRIRVIEAGHPVPDEAGLKAADDTLRQAAEATSDDLLLVLVS